MQAASEIKPILQVYIDKLSHKSKALSTGKSTENNLKVKPNKSWWAYPHSGWKEFAQHLEIPKKMLQQEERSLNKQTTSPKSSFVNDQNRNINLSPDMEIIKITTIIEAIRQKRQNIAQISKETRNIHKLIGRKRLKRSSRKSSNISTVTKNSRYIKEGKTSASDKQPRYSKHYYRDQQKESLPTKNGAIGHDLKTANGVAIPSTVFYKRIWEYINGTRPHSDITKGYNSAENNSEKDDSTCSDKDGIIASQSREEKLLINPNVKSEREFYKRIWDIINATHSTYGNAKARSKRNANISNDNAFASTQLCKQEKEVNYEGDKQVQTRNKKTALNTTDTINPRNIPTPAPYVSNFWTVANKTKWQPKTTIPVTNIVKLNNGLTSPYINTASASEVADLNKFPDKIESNFDYTFLDNTTEHVDKAPNRSQEIIIKPGPPYLPQREDSITPSFSPIEYTLDDASQRKEKHANYSDAIPIYDPSNIPYVEVPDYSDQQENSLDKNNRSSSAANTEYDDDYIDPKGFYNADDFSSESPNAEIKVLQSIQAENDEPKIPVNVNISHSRCTKDKDSAECIEKYEVEDTKLRNNTQDDTSDDVHYSIEDSAELPLSEERENSTVDFVNFDVKEYIKPFNYDDFIKDEPILQSIRASSNKETPVPTEASEEFETYGTHPKKQSYDYFAKNEDYQDDYGITSDEKDETKENPDSDEKEQAQNSEVNDDDYYPYNDKAFLKRIFENDGSKESSDIVDTEDEFLSRYFTKDVLKQLRDNSTTEEDKKREESRNKEEIHKTLSRILDKKDRFSRLDEDLDKMVEEGKAIPIKYDNFWSLEYESPYKENKAEEEKKEEA